MKQAISEITIRHISQKTLEEFAGTLGINASRQMVWFWKEGKQEPSFDTLSKVINSPTATAEAKAWAAECMEVRYGVRVGPAEPTFDQEIERRR